jgi:3-phenylpropionate/cinnamic acid dioxygenase small subunit
VETDDGTMSAAATSRTAVEMRQRAVAFLDLEADLLDRLEYREWLDLWDPSGLYVLPIERIDTDFESRLNHIYDDHDMRSKRVERLLSGHAPSATPIMRTVRSAMRVRLLESAPDQLLLSSSLHIVSYKRQVQNLIAANVRHRLLLDGDMIRIKEKVVQLINSDEPLAELSFIL